MKLCILIFISFYVMLYSAFAQFEIISIPLIKNKNLVSFNVKSSEETYLGIQSLKVIDSGDDTEAKFVKIVNFDFESGTIEIDVAGNPAQGHHKRHVALWVLHSGLTMIIRSLNAFI